MLVFCYCSLCNENERFIDKLRKGDFLVFWKIDRLSRSLKDLLIILDHMGRNRILKPYRNH